MSISSYLLVNGLSPLGRIVYKFEELSHVLEEVGERTLSQRVAIYALDLFVAFPVLMAYAAGSLALMPLELVAGSIAFLFGGPAFFKESLQQLVALIVFPLLAAGYLLVGKIPPTYPHLLLEGWSPQDVTANLRYLLDGFEGQAGYQLVQTYLENERKMGRFSSPAPILKLLIWDQTFGSGTHSVSMDSIWKLYPAYRALTPLVMQLTLEEYIEIFSVALSGRHLPLCALLWTLNAERLPQEGLRDNSLVIRKDLLAMCKKCEQLQVMSSGQEIGILTEQGMEEEWKKLIGNETIFKILLPRLPIMRRQLDNYRYPLESYPPFQSQDELFQKLEQQPELKKILIEHLIKLSQTIKKIDSKLSADTEGTLKTLLLASTPLPIDVVNIVMEYETVFNTPIKLSDFTVEIEPSTKKNAQNRQPDADEFLILKLVAKIKKISTKIDDVLRDKIYRWHLSGSPHAASIGAIAIGIYGLMETFLLLPIALCPIFLIATVEKIIMIALNLFKFCFFLDFTPACVKKILTDLAMLIGGNALFMLAETFFDSTKIEGPIKRALNTYIRCAYVQVSKK